MTGLRSRAERVVEVDGGMVDCVMDYNTVVREPADGGCGDHQWESEVAEEYDKPGPDMRNPIQVFECQECEAEKHSATSGSYWGGQR